MAEKIVNKYLARMRLEGRLTITDRNNMINEFNNVKCTIKNPDTDISATAIEPQARILRTGDPVQSEIYLQVTCTPEPQPFKALSLVGGDGGDTTIKAGGKDLSERIEP